jgi:hypothetical protein
MSSGLTNTRRQTPSIRNSSLQILVLLHRWFGLLRLVRKITLLEGLHGIKQMLIADR